MLKKKTPVHTSPLRKKQFALDLNWVLERIPRHYMQEACSHLATEGSHHKLWYKPGSPTLTKILCTEEDGVYRVFWLNLLAWQCEVTGTQMLRLEKQKVVLCLRAVPEIILGGGCRHFFVLWGKGVLLMCPRGGG